MFAQLQTVCTVVGGFRRETGDGREERKKRYGNREETTFCLGVYEQCRIISEKRRGHEVVDGRVEGVLEEKGVRAKRLEIQNDEILEKNMEK